MAARFPMPWRPEMPLPTGEEVRSLQEEVARLKEENFTLRGMLREVSACQEFAPALTPERLLPTQVIQRGDSNGLRQGIAIQAGWEEGIQPGDPVLHRSRSLVGVVREVGRHRSSVLLVTDPASRINAFGVDFRSSVMTRGLGKGRLSILHQKALVHPAEGEEILTEEDGRIPRGLILGRIMREGKDEIAPLWGCSDLEQVLVLLPKESRSP